MENFFEFQEFMHRLKATGTFKCYFSDTPIKKEGHEIIYGLNYRPHITHNSTTNNFCIKKIHEVLNQEWPKQFSVAVAGAGFDLCYIVPTGKNRNPEKDWVAFLKFFKHEAIFKPKYVVETKMKETAKKRRLRPKLDLTLLGVPAVLHSQKPTASTFPSAFNAHSRNIWNSILNDQDLMKYTARLEPLEQWEFVIKEYIAQCRKVSLPIFSERYCEELNTRLSSDFDRLRRKLVNFIQKQQFTDGIKMYAVKHDVQKLPTGGFDLYVSAKLRKVDGARIERHIACLGNRELWTESNEDEAIHEFDPLGRFHISNDLNKNGRMCYKIRAPHSPFVSARSLRDLTENKYFAKAKALWASEIEKIPLVYAKVKGRRKKKLVLF